MKRNANVNNESQVICAALQSMSVTGLGILALHYAEIVLRMEQPALRSFIARFMKDVDVRSRYIPTLVTAIMEHDWLRSSYDTLRGVDIERVATRFSEPTPKGDEARLAADAAALDGWNDPAA